LKICIHPDYLSFELEIIFERINEISFKSDNNFSSGELKYCDFKQSKANTLSHQLL